MERGLARSRSHAQELISASGVTVNGAIVTKTGADVGDDAVITLTEPPDYYVSRAAHKLAGALAEFEAAGLRVEGRQALDVGASTGGFTQVLLENGALHVTAVDVGHGQFSPHLASDPRVTVVEGLNVRDFLPSSPGAGASVVVGDLSFISLSLVIDPLTKACPDADFILLVKPQFELERASLNKRGVVRAGVDRARALHKVTAAAQRAGLKVVALTTSVLPGPQGNVEYVMWACGAWQASPMSDHLPLEGVALDERIGALTGVRP